MSNQNCYAARNVVKEVYIKYMTFASTAQQRKMAA